MKKSLIFWFAAVTCAALFLVGCESPTNGEKGAAGSTGPSLLPADATPAMLEAAFGKTDTVIVGLDLDAGTFVVPAGKTLKVAGDVSLTQATVINAFAGTFDVSEGKIGGPSAVFIVAPAARTAVEANVTAGLVPEKFTDTLSGSTPALTAPAVFESLSIGGSGEITATQFAIFATTHTAYVVGDVTIDTTGGAVLTNANLVVYGKIKAGNTAGTGSLTIPSTVEGSLTATSALGITGIDNLDDLDTSTYTVTSTDTTVALDSLDSGSGGKLVLTDAVTKVTIGGGNGNIEFNTGTPAFATNPSSFGNTGLTTFKADAGSTEVDISFAGPVSFEGDFERTSTSTGGELSFGGDVTVTATKKITLGGTDTVTLAAGKSIKVGSDAILTAGASADVVLTPVSGAVLTATTKTLTLGTQGLALTSGTLAVAAGAELALDSKDLTVTAADAALVLTGAASTGGAKLTGAGKVVLGNANIIGSTHGWQAVGANTSIAFSNSAAAAVAITGTGTTPKLAAAGATVGAITLGVQGSSNAALTVTNAEIDLTTGGSLVITYHSTASTVVLKGGAGVGKLTFNSAKNTADVSPTHYANIHKTSEAAKLADVAGTGIVVKGAADEGNTLAGSIAGGGAAGTNDATIMGQSSTNDVTLDNTATFKDD